MSILIIAGETIFILPFVVARIFRPTFLDAFELTNLELGLAFSVYGIIAMISYFFGGPLADKYPPRNLLSTALIVTACSGAVFATIPSLATLMILYGFWGITTILLFWSALIKATRLWGGRTTQGIAYGLLDGGRGLLAAVIASLSVMVFAGLMPVEVEGATITEKKEAIRKIIAYFSIFIGIVGILAWWVLPDQVNAEDSHQKDGWDIDGMIKVMKMPVIWLHALIILCAYVGYKCTDDFSLYASDAFDYDDVQAARLGTVSYWVRPVIAVIAGLLADRFNSSKVISFAFLTTLLGSLVIAVGWLPAEIYILLAMTIALTSAGIYALRGVYFALLQEARIPLLYTGSAVGLVSVVGFTPDIFMGPLMGVLIDNHPGALGHQYVFMVLAGFSLVGFIATVIFRKYFRVTS